MIGVKSLFALASATATDDREVKGLFRKNRRNCALCITDMYHSLPSRGNVFVNLEYDERVNLVRFLTPWLMGYATHTQTFAHHTTQQCTSTIMPEKYTSCITRVYEVLACMYVRSTKYFAYFFT